jgi:hypothetical protein
MGSVRVFENLTETKPKSLKPNWTETKRNVGGAESNRRETEIGLKSYEPNRSDPISDTGVHYLYDHVEHEDCYFDHHPHNVKYLMCGKGSDFLMFKYVQKIVFSSFQELVILIIFQ